MYADFNNKYLIETSGVWANILLNINGNMSIICSFRIKNTYWEIKIEDFVKNSIVKGDYPYINYCTGIKYCKSSLKDWQFFDIIQELIEHYNKYIIGGSIDIPVDERGLDNYDDELDEDEYEQKFYNKIVGDRFLTINTLKDIRKNFCQL